MAGRFEALIAAPLGCAEALPTVAGLVTPMLQRPFASPSPLVRVFSTVVEVAALTDDPTVATTGVQGRYRLVVASVAPLSKT